MSKCSQCGNELNSGDMHGTICNTCYDKTNISTVPFMFVNTNYGWICPKCGRVFGPSQLECSYCNAGYHLTVGT